MNFENFLANKKNKIKIKSYENFNTLENVGSPNKKQIFNFDDKNIIDSAAGPTTKFGILLDFL